MFGDDTLIMDNKEMFMNMLNKILNNRKKLEVIKDIAILENMSRYEQKFLYGENDEEKLEAGKTI
jgi:hypothetical protein